MNARSSEEVLREKLDINFPLKIKKDYSAISM